jgi:hypothetical protein
MLSVIYAECHIQALYFECRYAECQYAECRGALTLVTSPAALTQGLNTRLTIPW